MYQMKNIYIFVNNVIYILNETITSSLTKLTDVQSSGLYYFGLRIFYDVYRYYKIIQLITVVRL